ncbi:MAG: hypothetical protein WAN59_05920 [Candidatus Baltobacteraceae bacterium]|jgi:hypothetical protein
MAYVEFLRVRTRLLWFAAILAACALFIAVSAHGGGVHVRVGNGGADVTGVLGDDDASGAATGANHGTSNLAAALGAIPGDALLVAAGLLTLIFGSIVGPSLNREWDTLDFAWTQPLSRTRLALAYMSVDAGGIACAFVLALAFAFVPLSAAGLLGSVVVQRDALEVALVGLGSAFMWYALLQAASSWYAGRAGGLAQGLSWAAFTLLLGLGQTEQFGPLFHALLLALNFVNPLAYLSALTIHQNGTVTENAILPVGLGLRVLLVWAIGLAACALALAGWKRLEV